MAREDLFWTNMRRAFLGHCGFHPIKRSRLDQVKDIGPAEREKWLAEIHRLGEGGK